METFEIAAKKSKKRNVKRIVILSVLSTSTILGLLLAVHLILGRLQTSNYFRASELVETQYAVAYPNIEAVSSSTTATGAYTSILTINRVKDLDGAKIAYDPQTIYLSWNGFHSNLNSDSLSGMTKKGLEQGQVYTNSRLLKAPLFFNKQVHYDKEEPRVNPSQELPLVQQMKGQIVEVALTFDKPYSYEELQKLLPTNLKKNWYWTGTYSNYNVANLTLDSLYGLEVEEGNLQASYDSFYQNIKKLLVSEKGFKTIGGGSSIRYSSKKELEQIKKTMPKLEQARFSGIILTGKAENFAQLEGKEWIYASSIGASTLNQPYYQLEKE